METIFVKKLYTGIEVKNNCQIKFDKKLIKSVTKSKKMNPSKTFEVITPAFIDPHSHIGMFRAGEPSQESEGNDHIDPVIAHADALDSIQMDDKGFSSSIENGILYSCVLPGSGNIIGGNSAFIRNYGSNTTTALIGRAGIKGAFGYNPMSTVDWKGVRPFTRMGVTAILRSKFTDVKNKLSKKNPDPLTLEEKVLQKLLNQEEVLRVHVHKTDDIASLLRIVDEYNLKITVEHACDVHDSEIFKKLKKRDIPVIYGPIDSLAYKVELKHESWRNIKYLIESGVEYGLMTDHPVILQRMLFYTLRWFLRSGLSKQDCIELISRKNAEIIGFSDILGTLEKNKWASFICWNGDPFDLTSYPTAVYGEGELLFSDN